MQNYIRVSTIEDIIDCRDTYEKVRVFSYFLALFAIFGLVNTTLSICNWTQKNHVKTWTDKRFKTKINLFLLSMLYPR